MGGDGATIGALTDEQATAIRCVPHFTDSFYNDLDVRRCLDFFHRRFVQPISAILDIKDLVVVDAACGYGWFGLAYLLAGGRGVISVDVDLARLNAARAIAGILGLDERSIFVNAGLEALPVRARGAHLVVSIETLEHVGKQNIKAAIDEIGRVPSHGLLITTPNKWFPVIAHDTRIPFLHYLPPTWRRPLASLVGRSEMDEGNVFLSPWDLRSLGRRFRRISRCYTFGSWAEYRDHFPLYLPYGDNETARLQQGPSFAKRLLFSTASTIFGRKSHIALPTLAGFYVSRRIPPDFSG